LTKVSGGNVWDEVSEYRVWCHPEHGAPEDNGDYYYAFAFYEAALEFSRETEGAEEPLALILQKEYISVPEPGQYMHIKEERLTEWPVEFLRRPRRTNLTISEFMSPNAPAGRRVVGRGHS
jgi:putative acetyltransferase